MRTYDSRVIRRTLVSTVKVKNGTQEMVYKEFVVPLEFNHPFAEDELVTVVRKEDLEWFLKSLKDLEKDKSRLEKHIEVLRDRQ